MIDHEQRIGDQNVRVVAIPTISLKALNSGDYTVQQELREAASDPGFFYLDLSCNLLGDRVLADLQDLYALADKYFTQTDEVKLRDVRKDITPSQDLGYKSSPCDETFEVWLFTCCLRSDCR
jgi:isopenicillin N synthase-like dioxygenase